MLQHPLNQALLDLGLRGMARALERSQREPSTEHLSFEDRLGLLLDVEQVERQNLRYAQRIRWAKLAQPANTEDLDRSAGRGLDARLMSQLITLNWIDQRLNLLVIGPTGVGKSYLACALAHAACKADHSVRYIRLPRLLEELALSEANNRRSLPASFPSNTGTSTSATQPLLTPFWIVWCTTRTASRSKVSPCDAKKHFKVPSI